MVQGCQRTEIYKRMVELGNRVLPGWGESGAGRGHLAAGLSKGHIKKGGCGWEGAKLPPNDRNYIRPRGILQKGRGGEAPPPSRVNDGAISLQPGQLRLVQGAPAQTKLLAYQTMCKYNTYKKRKTNRGIHKEAYLITHHQRFPR